MMVEQVKRAILVSERHFPFFGASHHMMVGHNDASRVDDKTAADGVPLTRLDVNPYDGWFDPLDQVGKRKLLGSPS